MPPCKGHKKSRKGCLACKRRRVKCDEGYPACANCTRRREGKDCVFPHLAADDYNFPTAIAPEPHLDVIQAPESQISIISGQLCTVCGHLHTYPTTISIISVEFPGALPACFLSNFIPAISSTSESSQASNGNEGDYCGDHSGTLSLVDLTLLHHFTVYTAKAMTVFTQPEVLKAWTEIVPRIGQAYPFVMHAILAAAAAHTYCCHTEDSMMDVGERHYTEAVKGIIQELGGLGDDNGTRRITEDNCHALFLAINLSNLYTLSTSRCRYLLDNNNDCGQKRKRKNSPRRRLVALHRLDVTWTAFTRCSFGVLDKSWKWIINGPIAPIFLPYPSIPKAMPTLSKRTETMLTELLRLCGDGLLDGAAEELADVQVATAYFAAVWNLRKVWGVLEEYVTDDAVRCAWYEWRSTHTTLEKAAALYSAIFQFVLRTPATFWECLDKKKPRALVIYAYFVACFEALNFGCDSSNPWSHLDSQTGSTAATWWILGRAENDLRCVEDELRVLGVEDIWRNWVAGAWRIWEGLRKGWWFDIDVDVDSAWNNADSGALTVVTRYSSTTISADSFEHGRLGYDANSDVQLQDRTDSLDYMTMNYSFPPFDEQWIAGLLERGSESMVEMEGFLGSISEQRDAVDSGETGACPS